jgi:hypothetical protein
MSRELTERELWFRSKIGQRLYRNETSCQCGVCKNVAENGLIVNDQFHADYLYDCEAESNGEGYPLRYFDTKEEVNEWLKGLPAVQ